MLKKKMLEENYMNITENNSKHDIKNRLQYLNQDKNAVKTCPLLSDWKYVLKKKTYWKVLQTVLKY